MYLEVGVNEEVSKDENPNVPYGTEETARNVVYCIPPELDWFIKLGLAPSIAVFNAADLRWVILATRGLATKSSSCLMRRAPPNAVKSFGSMR